MSLRLAGTLAPGALSTVATLAGVLLFSLTPPETAPVGLRLEDAYPFITLQVSLGTVGAAIAWRHPANPIGWLLSASGLAAGLAYFAGGYATYGSLSEDGLPSADVAGWIFTWGKVAMGLGVLPILLLFPDGRLRSRGARVGLAAGVSSIVLTVGVIAFHPGPLLGIGFVENPYGWRDGSAILDLALAVALLPGLAFSSSRPARCVRAIKSPAAPSANS